MKINSFFFFNQLSLYWLVVYNNVKNWFEINFNLYTCSKRRGIKDYI